MKSQISVTQSQSAKNASSKSFSQKNIGPIEEEEEPQLIEFQDIELDVIQQDIPHSISPSSELATHVNDLKKVKINQYLEKARSKYMKQPESQRTIFRRQTAAKIDQVNKTELLKQQLHNIEYQTLYHREIQKFMIAFASNPQKAVQDQINNGILKDDPKAIAQYLVQKQAINKDKLGEYFGEDDPKILEVLSHYCRFLNIRNLEFDKSLRLLLSKFKIPGEAQKIQRIVWKFAQVYFESHSHEFNSASEIHILSYALIMLNSDAHNPNQHNKMTLTQFLKNTSPVCPGISKKYLQQMYDRIVNDKFETQVNYIQKIYNRLSMLNLSITISGLSDVLSNVMQLMKGHVFIKFCWGKVKSVQRKVYLSEDQKEIRWIDANTKIQRYRSIKTEDIKDLVLGCSTQVMKTNKVPAQFDSMCFSIITSKRSLDLKARDTNTRAKWVNYIGALLIQKRQNRKIKEQTEFNLHFSKQKIEDKWNTSIFTKWDEHWDYKLKRPKVLKYEIVHNVLKGFCCGSTNEKVYDIQKDDSSFFSLNGPLLSTLWKFGLPEGSRKTLWPIVIGNSLGLTPALYELYKKKKRQIPEIEKLPYSYECIQLVEMLAVIRPDISLVRNLLQIAQMFSKYLDPYDAFCSFVNTMHVYHFLPFFQGDMNQIQSRIVFFQYLLQKNLPFVSMHFKALQIKTKIYFVNWFLSIFSHCFPHTFLARIWDNFLLDGEIYLFKVGLTLIKYYEFQLKMSTFDEVIRLLTRPKGTSEVLFFKILDDQISIHQEQYDEYIQKRKYAFIKTKVQEIPLQ